MPMSDQSKRSAINFFKDQVIRKGSEPPGIPSISLTAPRSRVALPSGHDYLAQ